MNNSGFIPVEVQPQARDSRNRMNSGAGFFENNQQFGENHQNIYASAGPFQDIEVKPRSNVPTRKVGSYSAYPNQASNTKGRRSANFLPELFGSGMAPQRIVDPSHEHEVIVPGNKFGSGTKQNLNRTSYQTNPNSVLNQNFGEVNQPQNVANEQKVQALLDKYSKRPEVPASFSEHLNQNRRSAYDKPQEVIYSPNEHREMPRAIPNQAGSPLLTSRSNLALEATNNIYQPSRLEKKLSSQDMQHVQYQSQNSGMRMDVARSHVDRVQPLNLVFHGGSPKRQDSYSSVHRQQSFASSSSKLEERLVNQPIQAYQSRVSPDINRPIAPVREQEVKHNFVNNGDRLHQGKTPLVVANTGKKQGDARQQQVRETYASGFSSPKNDVKVTRYSHNLDGTVTMLSQNDFPRNAIPTILNEPVPPATINERRSQNDIEVFESRQRRTSAPRVEQENIQYNSVPAVTQHVQGRTSPRFSPGRVQSQTFQESIHQPAVVSGNRQNLLGQQNSLRDSRFKHQINEVDQRALNRENIPRSERFSQEKTRSGRYSARQQEEDAQNYGNNGPVVVEVDFHKLR